MSARLRRLGTDDAGIGVVELIVSTMLSAVLLAMVAAMFVNIAHATTSANQSSEGSSAAGTIANGVSAVIRSGAQNAVAGQTALDPAVVAGAADSVTLYSLTDASPAAPAPTKVRFTVTGGQLVEERWRAVAAAGYWTFGSGAPDSTRSLGGTVVASTDPFFAYLDAAGAAVTPGAGGLTPAQRATVASVRLTVRVRAASSPTAGVVTLQNTVGMPNLAYSGSGR